MGMEGTQNWSGKSGKTYSFEVWNLATTTFNEVECIYIYTKLVNNYWQYIYVGQTSQLATRVYQHSTGNDASDKCIQRSSATYLHVLKLTPESARLDVETDIRNNPNYRWSCNMQ
jgi:predicted GIY-YIG superfamily endonuclease